MTLLSAPVTHQQPDAYHATTRRSAPPGRAFAAMSEALRGDRSAARSPCQLRARAARLRDLRDERESPSCGAPSAKDDQDARPAPGLPDHGLAGVALHAERPGRAKAVDAVEVDDHRGTALLRILLLLALWGVPVDGVVRRRVDPSVACEREERGRPAVVQVEQRHLRALGDRL